MHRRIVAESLRVWLRDGRAHSGRKFATSAWQRSNRVGFIGLGNMGSHMASYVQKGGNRLVVCDTNPAAVKPFAVADAEVASTPADVASQADRVITMVPTPADVRTVYLGPNGLIGGGRARPGSILIDCSTVDPATSRDIGTAAAEAGVEFVDAPVTGAEPAARAGTLTFLVGGEQKNVDAIRGLLLTMGKNVVHCGPIGAGEIAKICNNMMLAISMIGTAETLHLAERLGLDPKLMTSILNISSGRTWVSEGYNPVPGVSEDGDKTPSNRGYKPGFASRLMAKDLVLAQSIAVESQSPIPMGSLAAVFYRLMVNNGAGERDFSYPYEFMKQNNN